MSKTFEALGKGAFRIFYPMFAIKACGLTSLSWWWVFTPLGFALALCVLHGINSAVVKWHDDHYKRVDH